MLLRYGSIFFFSLLFAHLKNSSSLQLYAKLCEACALWQAQAQPPLQSFYLHCSFSRQHNGAGSAWFCFLRKHNCGVYTPEDLDLPPPRICFMCLLLTTYRIRFVSRVLGQSTSGAACLILAVHSAVNKIWHRQALVQIEPL